MKQAAVHPFSTNTLCPLSVVMLLIYAFSPRIVHGQELTIYAIPPKAQINWTSPRSLFLSYAGSVFTKNIYNRHSHPMGHVIIELSDSCHYAIAGMSPRSKTSMASKVYLHGYGLGMFFANISGKLAEGQFNLNDLQKRYPNGDVAYIKFKLNSAAFALLWQYLEDYKHNGYDKIYNGENKPREGKGAGCSAFGVSFIEIAGLLSNQELSKWSVSVNVPENLIGGPPNNNTHVGLLKILRSRKWADTQKHEYRVAGYYEPSLMFRWIQEEWNKQETVLRSYKELRGNTKGIVIDCTQQPVPTEPALTTHPEFVNVVYQGHNN